ncbi:MAG: hypothetical protein Q7U71_00120 [bacterium]|nr:hypothetical protein [bacterium]
MNKPKTGACLLAVIVVLSFMANIGLCQTYLSGNGGKPVYYMDLYPDLPSYYSFDSTSHLLSVTNGVTMETNVLYILSHTFKVGWFLSLDNSITANDYLIGSQTITMLAGVRRYDTLTLSVDLDTVSSLFKKIAAIIISVFLLITTARSLNM